MTKLLCWCWSDQVDQPTISKESQSHILLYKTEVTPVKQKENEQSWIAMVVIEFNYFKWKNILIFLLDTYSGNLDKIIQCE